MSVTPLGYSSVVRSPVPMNCLVVLGGLEPESMCGLPSVSGKVAGGKSRSIRCCLVLCSLVFGDVLPQSFVHPGLPAFASFFEVRENFRAVPDSNRHFRRPPLRSPFAGGANFALCPELRHCLRIVGVIWALEIVHTFGSGIQCRYHLFLAKAQGLGSTLLFHACHHIDRKLFGRCLRARSTPGKRLVLETNPGSATAFRRRPPVRPPP